MKTFLSRMRGIYTIELSSRCNLRCTYCPSPKMVDGVPGFRAAVDLSEEDFAATLDLVRHFVREGTQDELNLMGIGESTLHPRFVEYVGRAREALGPERRLGFTTNGLAYDDAIAAALTPFRVHVGVSLHVGLKRAKPAITAAKRFNLYTGTAAAAADESISWAGQVDWPDDSPRFTCHFLSEGRGMVCADGNLTACCLDAQGLGNAGHITAIRDTILGGGEVFTSPSTLCRGCHHTLPNWDQKEAIQHPRVTDQRTRLTRRS